MSETVQVNVSEDCIAGHFDLMVTSVCA